MPVTLPGKVKSVFLVSYVLIDKRHNQLYYSTPLLGIDVIQIYLLISTLV